MAVATVKVKPVKEPPPRYQHAMDVKLWDPSASGDAARTRPLHLVVVVGSGGTGARLIPPLTKMLLPTDEIVCIDHDVVEARNVGRQNFSRDDIGKYKAQVMEERYHSPGDDGPNVMAVTSQFTRAIMTETVRDALTRRRFANVFLIGCVDSIPARKEMYLSATEDMRNWNIPSSYIDAGNETRTGQVVLAYARHQTVMRESTVFRLPEMAKRPLNNGYPVTFRGAEMFPDLFGLVPDADSENPDAGVGCAIRMDLQTVAINQMAATATINLLVPFLYPGVSLRNLGVTFSTYNTMSPILPTRVEIGMSGEVLACELPREQPSA